MQRSEAITYALVALLGFGCGVGAVVWVWWVFFIK